MQNKKKMIEIVHCFPDFDPYPGKSPNWRDVISESTGRLAAVHSSWVHFDRSDRVSAVTEGCSQAQPSLFCAGALNRNWSMESKSHKLMVSGLKLLMVGGVSGPWIQI